MKKNFLKHRGFSILMALGIIAVLMIVVVGLAGMYMREYKLSRLSYDEVIANNSAEGAFEYGMLKIKNHLDGFSDSMTSEDLDGKNFILSSPRNNDLKVKYEIMASSTGETFKIESNKMLVIPLFIGEGEILSNNSKKPTINTSTTPTNDLNITSIDMNNIIWSISSTNLDDTDFQNPNIILQGKGEISQSSKGKTQIQAMDCYKKSSSGISGPDKNYCNDADVEVLQYSFEEEFNVYDFIKNGEKTSSKGNSYKTENSYLILYNNSTSDIEIEIKSSTPFSLPTRKITATATKGDASQIFSFSENNNQYYESMLNSYFNTNP